MKLEIQRLETIQLEKENELAGMIVNHENQLRDKDDRISELEEQLEDRADSQGS